MRTATVTRRCDHSGKVQVHSDTSFMHCPTQADTVSELIYKNAQLTLYAVMGIGWHRYTANLILVLILITI